MTNKEKQCQALLISLPYYLVCWKHNSRKLLCGTHTCSLWFGPVLSYRNRGIYWTAGMFFFKIQETFTVSLWEPLKSISCLQFQDILVFEQRAKGASDLWISTFNKQMTVNVHILIAHGGIIGTARGLLSPQRDLLISWIKLSKKQTPTVWPG